MKSVRNSSDDVICELNQVSHRQMIWKCSVKTPFDFFDLFSMLIKLCVLSCRLLRNTSQALLLEFELA